MDQLVNVVDSYAARRQLFKNIWDTALNIEDKDADILNKPKVIKTLRLDEIDRCAIKKKKQKLKNLRTVCNKILDFCDKQEADDIKYEKMKMQPYTTVQLQTIIKPMKLKKTRFKSKAIHSKKLSLRTEDHAQPKFTSSERKDESTDIDEAKKTSQDQSSSSKAGTNVMANVLVTHPKQSKLRKVSRYHPKKGSNC